MKKIFNVFVFAVKVAIISVIAAVAFAVVKAPVVFGVLLIGGAAILMIKAAAAVGLAIGAVLGTIASIFFKKDEEAIANEIREMCEANGFTYVDETAGEVK